MTATLLLAFSAPPLAAQIDYRNLDDDRPVVTEDAYPVERFAFELLVPYSFVDQADGAQIHSTVPELTYGLLRNAQLGLKLPLAGADAGTGAGTDWGIAGLRLFGLYNFNTESRSLPALSLRADADFPVGSLAGNATRLGIKGIATRSWGAVRAHLNASLGFGSEQALSVVDPLSRWALSLALDRTMFRPSILLVGDLAASQAISGSATEVKLSLGGRWQWTPSLVLDLGLSRRLSDAGPDIALTIGLSHVFAVSGLMPEPLR
jgi:hypothetical protein